MTGDKQHDATSELNEALAAGFAASNFEALGPFYTEDATLLPPRGKAREGRDAAAAFWGTVANRFNAVNFTTGTLKDLGEAARRETGTFTMTGDGQAAEGKYVFVWQLVDGEWQIESAIWNRGGEGGAGGRAQGQRRAGIGQGGGGYRGGGPGRNGGYRAGRPSFQGGQGGGGRRGAGRRGGPGGGAQGDSGDAGGSSYDGQAGLYSDPKA